jgi:hypothetical protein
MLNDWRDRDGGGRWGMRIEAAIWTALTLVGMLSCVIWVWSQVSN